MQGGRPYRWMSWPGPSRCCPVALAAWISEEGNFVPRLSHGWRSSSAPGLACRRSPLRLSRGQRRIAAAKMHQQKRGRKFVRPCAPSSRLSQIRDTRPRAVSQRSRQSHSAAGGGSPCPRKGTCAARRRAGQFVTSALACLCTGHRLARRAAAAKIGAEGWRTLAAGSRHVRGYEQ